VELPRMKSLLKFLFFGAIIGALWQLNIVATALEQHWEYYDFPFKLKRLHGGEYGGDIWLAQDFWFLIIIASAIGLIMVSE